MSRRITTVGSRRGEGGTVVGFSVEVLNAREVEAALLALTDTSAKKALDSATRAAAVVFRKTVKAEAPQGSTGRLKKSVRMKKARGGTGHIVSPRPKIAFYRHMVIKGTKEHRIRFPDQKARNINKRFGNIKHPGIKLGNPFVERGFEGGRPEAERKMKASLSAWIEEKTGGV